MSVTIGICFAEKRPTIVGQHLSWKTGIRGLCEMEKGVNVMANDTLSQEICHGKKSVSLKTVRIFGRVSEQGFRSICSSGFRNRVPMNTFA